MAQDTDIKHFTEARQALAKISRSGETPLSLDGIFGERRNKWWSRQIIKRALRAGIIEIMPKEHLRALSFYRGLPGLQETMESDALLSEMLWPTAHFDPTRELVDGEGAPSSERADDLSEAYEDDEDGEGDDDDVADEGEPDDVPVPNTPRVVSGEPEPTEAEMLAGLVRMAAAILENVVYTRKKIDVMSEQLAKLDERFEKFEETWS